ncbi:hypothetical protein C8R44DRAFT_742687 [Mycena epipterygia]|nr:hypothetical protein C8R44DRAFT_742687 [Mycena epipterygia]
MRFAPMLAAFILCLVKVQPATSRAISVEARTPLGGFGYVHGPPTDEEMEKRAPLGGFGYVHGPPTDEEMEKRAPLGGFGYVHGSPTDEEMEKRAPLGGFGYVHGYTNEDVTEGSPTAASVEGRALFGLAA